jgi:predicted nucleotide-binding protein (sugar kinase/HSP70/actin superfamily)
MLELIRSGVNNIVSAQPFGCLPNHIVAKGMIRKIKDNFPFANIVAVDYDPGASRINQENRIKLMLANARRHAEPAVLEYEKAPKKAPLYERPYPLYAPTARL